jgi:hypothetical protein
MLKEADWITTGGERVWDSVGGGGCNFFVVAAMAIRKGRDDGLKG